MGNQNIIVEQHAEDSVYVRLSKDATKRGKMLRIEELVPNYRGPMVNFDFDINGLLVGIEVVMFENSTDED